jgi:pimeloyl-ACP methyl ester carboxylesterase
MPYANNHGVKIYYEVEGEGPPLVLAHGGTQNLNLWEQWASLKLLKDPSNSYSLTSVAMV